MLGQQYLENTKYENYLTSHFVLFRADRTQKQGDETFNKFSIRATPTVMILDPDGSEVDWHVGYSPPAEKFHEQIDKSYKGIETFKYYAGLYAKNPKDVAVVFNLAKKYDRRYNQEKAIALYKEAIALDPEGTSGTTEFGRIKIPNTQYAEFQIGYTLLFGMKIDPEPMKSFIKKYKTGEMVKTAYQRLSSYYSRSGSKEEAVKFFEEALAAVPNDPQLVSAFARKSISSKENIDKAIGLSEKLTASMGYNSDPSSVRDLAELYVVKGDSAKADEAYGKEYMEGRVSSLAYNLTSYAMFWSTKSMNQESAVAMAELATKIKPGDEYFIRQAASVCCAQKKYDKALEFYGPKYIGQFMSDANKLSSYASFWGGQGNNLESALQAGKKAVDLAPSLPSTWMALATVYQKKKDNEEALKAGEKALEMAPENQKSFYKNRLEALKKAMEPK